MSVELVRSQSGDGPLPPTPPAPPSPCPPELLPGVVVRLGRLLERRMNAALRPHGLSAAHYLALSYLRGHPGLSRADLARGLQVSPQAAGGIIDALLRRRLVVRSGDGRGTPLEFTLSDCGIELLDAARPAVERVSGEVYARLARDHARILDGSVRRLLMTMSELS